MTPHEYWTKLVQEFCLSGELVLRGMKLDSIHEVVFDKDIRVLNINDNKIGFIPEEIGRLQSLKALYVNQNYLDKLPYSLAALSNL